MPDARNRLLVVDDEPAVCRVVRRVGELAGFRVSVCHDVEGFESAYAAFEPTVLFLDLLLGPHDGVEILRALAARGSRTPVILASGMDERVLHSAARLAASLDLTVVAELKKPMSVATLRDALESCWHAEDGSGDHAPAHAALAPGEELAGALETNALTVHYQPQVSIADGHLAGMEALVRWNHPTKGLIGPAAFMARAERGRFVRSLTGFVLRSALSQAVRTAASGHDLRVSVNLSPTLLDELTLPDAIDRIVAEAGVHPSRLTLEITEGVAVSRPQHAIDVLTRLRLKGFGLALDDFGIGFSSLSELQHMPFTEVKIDKSFVMDAATDPSARAIVDAVIGLAHRLSLRVVAEGIENEAAWTLLKHAGCDIGQGYFISPPLDAAELERFLDHHRQRNGGPELAAS
jgi:EAL domain-containing protein (putative c-di-GMP-specific phosphodiesterase class I)/FixJ family two-component response regulator